MVVDNFKRFLLRLEFDGADFCGWQMQDNDGKPSLQETIELAITTALRRNQERFVVKGCGRTDSGVHAEEYFAHVDLPFDPQLENEKSIERFRHSVNCLLPDSVCVTDIKTVSKNFHSIEDVESKIYEYRILVRRVKPTLQRKRLYWLPLAPEEFPEDLLLNAVKLFEGIHDFKAFSAANSNAKTTLREILKVDLIGENVGRGLNQGRLLKIRFEGRGFLKQMVRNMVGTALDVSLKKRNLQSIERLLGRDEDGKVGTRQEAGLCVPAYGLFLLRVKYRGEETTSAQ